MRSLLHRGLAKARKTRVRTAKAASTRRAERIYTASLTSKAVEWCIENSTDTDSVGARAALSSEKVDRGGRVVGPGPLAYLNPDGKEKGAKVCVPFLPTP